VNDLNVTGESAMTTAIELVAADEADALLAGSVEETSPMIERCLGPVCERIVTRGPRSEGAAIAVFEAASSARARGAEIVARVAWWTSWRDPAEVPLAGVPAPPEGALVVVGRLPAQVAELLRGTSWEAIPVRALAPRAGDHEGAGGFAVVAGAAAIARGSTSAVLVVGRAVGRGYALLLAAPEEPS
jgi:3-oxoacyl-[acyl-carrier-protein] synthase II